MSNTFQVDLRGIVDLLSHHLYASPRVYIRELLQNAVDAITAAGRTTGGVAAIETVDGGLRISDNGIGLTEEQVHELLATIGRSSKRDELGFARHEFLGQFGIGLLSCFLVADEIRVHTRREGSPAVLWTGHSDGRYDVAPGPEREPGTTVTLLPRRGSEQWLTPATVTQLAGLYGSLLPIEVTVDGVTTTVGRTPWSAGRQTLIAYAEETLGFTPFDVIELDVPEAGLTGAAFVLPTPVNPATRGGHRVYLKQMLLAENVEGLLPEWAFFARCVVDSTELRPTASREALYDDSLLDATREAIADQLRGWLVRLSTTDPRRLAEFLHVHHLGVKALALHDDEMLRLVEQWWPMETNTGQTTLAEFRARHGLIRYAATTDEFRQLAAVAAAQDVAVVNAGYTYDVEIIERLPALDRSILVERLEPTDLSTRFESVEPGTELRLRPFPVGRPAAPRPARLRGRAAFVRAGLAARAVPGDPVGRLPRGAAEHPGQGRRPVGRGPRRDRRVRPARATAARAQPPQPAGPPGQRARRPGPGLARRRRALRAGAAARLPPDPSRRRCPAQRLVPRPAQPGRPARGAGVKTVDELWQLLNESRHLPFGAGQIAAVEQVLRHADATGDRHLMFASRMQATEAYVTGGEKAKSFVTFSWSLSDFDREPAPFHQRYQHTLLWHFKYMITALVDFPEIPLARTYAVLDDMERRYRGERPHAARRLHAPLPGRGPRRRHGRGRPLLRAVDDHAPGRPLRLRRLRPVDPRRLSERSRPLRRGRRAG